MIEKRFEQVKTVHEIAPVLLKDEGRIEALFTLYFLALLVQALIERELRLGMKREDIDGASFVPGAASVHTAYDRTDFAPVQPRRTARTVRDEHTVQVFEVEFTDLQRQVLTLLGVPEPAYRLSV